MVSSIEEQDSKERSDAKSITVMVNEPINETPVAIASANVLVGNAPLKVNFTGNHSTDDTGIASFLWGFPKKTSTESNAIQIFSVPGTYNITLTVFDEQGLSDSSSLTITVSPRGGKK